MKNHRPRHSASARPDAAAADDETLSQKLDLHSPLEPDQDQIARGAYALWEKSDHAHGHDQEHWFTAERELRQRSAAPDKGEGNAPQSDPSHRE